MWNAECRPGDVPTASPEAELRPEPDPLSPKANLEAIASILAVGVLRRRARRPGFRVSGHAVRRPASSARTRSFDNCSSTPGPYSVTEWSSAGVSCCSSFVAGGGRQDVSQ